MADRRDPYYESAPEIRAAIERLAAQHAERLDRWLRELEAVGADSNEVLSLLSQIAALTVDRAMDRMIARAVELGYGRRAETAEAGQALARQFLEDVLLRASLLPTRKPSDG
jgi:hypothetical protein